MATSLASPYGSGAAISGSWFPTGFHGHSRTGRRNDFVNEFRYRAKPSPPVVFLQRSTQRPDSHIFSLHDNREAYLRPEQSCAKRELSEKGAQTRLFDGEFFDLGLGRRKIANSSQRSDNKMFWWAPQQADFEAPGYPQLSMYRSSYNAQQTPKQVYIPNVSDPSLNERFTTIYRYTYGANHPHNNGVIINVMNNAPLGVTPVPPQSAPLSNGRRRALTSTDTVRSCLVWAPEKRENRNGSQSVAPPKIVNEAVKFTPVSVVAPEPAAVMCEDYPAKPLVMAPNRSSVIHDTPYTNEATMAALANRQRGINGVKSTAVRISEPPVASELKQANSSVVAETSGLARSRSEADLSRPKTSESIIFSTRLW